MINNRIYSSNIEKFLSSLCLGYSKDFVYTYWEKRAILKDGRELFVYSIQKENEYSDVYSTIKPAVDVPAQGVINIKRSDLGIRL